MPITPGEGGIKEDVPIKYRERFEKWKAELLSTSFGRAEWERYATRKDFVLTIKITNDRGKGAGTDRFRWDNNGNFIGATITLGSAVDQGYPAPVYYPVLNSLSSNDTVYSVSGSILAATKISHEIGHVNQTALSNAKLLEIQDRLMPQYIAIFLKNGLNAQDQRLLDLVAQMGGTPVEIWERREYGSEVNAMNYLSERLGNEEFYCDVLSRIRQNLTSYAREYEQMFAEDLKTNEARCGK
ncbi:MAG: hypothetical protein ABL959_13160 [Pyrinomonadaceae bacterium]